MAERKCFVIDSTVFLFRPDCILSFRDSDVILSIGTIQDLERVANSGTTESLHAAQSIRFIDSFVKRGKPSEGIAFSEINSRIWVKSLPENTDTEKYLNSTSIGIACLEKASGRNVFFVSRSITSRMKASELKLNALNYEKSIREFDDTRENIFSLDANGVCEPLILSLPRLLRTAFKQYLIYFNDYAQNSRRLPLALDISEDFDGLMLIPSWWGTADLMVMNKCFLEYLAYSRVSVDSINIDSSSLTEHERSVATIELKSQIRHLQTQLEIKKEKIDLLDDQLKDLKSLLAKSVERSPNLQLTIGQTVSQSTTVSVEQTLENNLGNIQEALDILTTELRNTGFSSQADEIGEKVFSLSKTEDRAVYVSVFSKLRLFLSRVSIGIASAVETVPTVLSSVTRCIDLYNILAGVFSLPILPSIRESSPTSRSI